MRSGIRWGSKSRSNIYKDRGALERQVVEGSRRHCRRRRDARRRQTLGFRLMDHFSSLDSTLGRSRRLPRSLQNPRTLPPSTFKLPPYDSSIVDIHSSKTSFRVPSCFYEFSTSRMSLRCSGQFSAIVIRAWNARFQSIATTIFNY